MVLALFISVSIIITVLTVLIIMLFKSMSKRTASSSDVNLFASPSQRAQPSNAETSRRVGPRRRMVRTLDSDNEAEFSGDEEVDDRDRMMQEIIEQAEGKVGAKKLRKLQEKAEKKANREAAEQEREDRKQREVLRELQRQELDEKRKQEEAVLAEEERLKKEEEEKREHEEYLKMKEMFSIDEEGEKDLDADLGNENLLQEFISYIKDMKVVLLEDIAAHFKIKTQDAIDRITALQESGDITGVVDDRGKFIYITMDELMAVGHFIEQRGRVSIAELAESSNRVINLSPDNSNTVRQLYQPIST